MMREAGDTAMGAIAESGRKAASNPILTITGPLGFGGYLLFVQLQGIQSSQAEVTRAQAEMRNEVTALTGKVDAIAKAADARNGQIEAMRTDIRDMRSRLDRIEATDTPKRKR